MQSQLKMPRWDCQPLSLNIYKHIYIYIYTSTKCQTVFMTLTFNCICVGLLTCGRSPPSSPSVADAHHLSPGRVQGLPYQPPLTTISFKLVLVTATLVKIGLHLWLLLLSSGQTTQTRYLKRWASICNHQGKWASFVTIELGWLCSVTIMEKQRWVSFVTTTLGWEPLCNHQGNRWTSFVTIILGWASFCLTAQLKCFSVIKWITVDIRHYGFSPLC